MSCFFGLAVPENFVWETFFAWEIWHRKKTRIRKLRGGRGVSRFTVRIVLSHSAEKKSYRNPSVSHLFSGTEKFYALQG